ncbi:MAG TPA: hypothetical protein PLV42_02840 [bacterium]|nr:hypothetical protein [bacterium]
MKPILFTVPALLLAFFSTPGSALAADNDSILADEDTLVTDDVVPTECTAITLSDVAIANGVYQAALSETIGTADLADLFQIEFYTADLSALRTDLVVGSYDLASEANDNYATCTECVRVFEDIAADNSGVAATYFQYSGAIEIAEIGTRPLESKGSIHVFVHEVTIDASTYESTPVAGGACYEITGAWDTICVPSCGDAVCGTDGCGGECGAGCETGKQCNADRSGCIDCTAITIADIVPNIDYPSLYQGVVVEELGDTFDDLFQIEFYGEQVPGTYDLTGTNYYDCSQCVVVTQDGVDDPAALPKVFFQESGSLVLDAAILVDGEMGAESKGHLDGVRLVEVTIASDYTSTPVPGGSCLAITEAEWDTMGAATTDDDALLTDDEITDSVVTDAADTLIDEDIVATDDTDTQKKSDDGCGCSVIF